MATTAELKAQIAQLTAERDAMQAKIAAQANRPLTCKVSAKGAVSVYGLGRFPCTLYRGQMAKLLDHADAIRKFMVDNASKLAVKGTAPAAPAAPATEAEETDPNANVAE